MAFAERSWPGLAPAGDLPFCCTTKSDGKKRALHPASPKASRSESFAATCARSKRRHWLKGRENCQQPARVASAKPSQFAWEGAQPTSNSLHIHVTSQSRCVSRWCLNPWFGVADSASQSKYVSRWCLNPGSALPMQHLSRDA